MQYFNSKRPLNNNEGMFPKSYDVYSVDDFLFQDLYFEDQAIDHLNLDIGLDTNSVCCSEILCLVCDRYKQFQENYIFYEKGKFNSIMLLTFFCL